jgi:four helix bundle protein
MRNYRDLQVWQKAHELTLELYTITRTFAVDEKYGLTSQMRRASVSIGANLAEGCGRSSEAEFARFVRVAMGSGAELFYELLVARDVALLRHADYTRLDGELSTVMRMLSSLLSKLASSRSVVMKT